MEQKSLTKIILKSVVWGVGAGIIFYGLKSGSNYLQYKFSNTEFLTGDGKNITESFKFLRYKVQADSNIVTSMFFGLGAGMGNAFISFLEKYGNKK